AHWVEGFEDDVDSYEYYTEDKYFQKKKVTDAKGNITEFDYGDRYGADGEKGNLLWVRDARYPVTGEQFEYEYNEFGQKTREINSNNIVTDYTYGDQWGNLTQVVQDPNGLDRITELVYDVAGRVISRTDPMGKTSTVDYNNLGQPLAAYFPEPDSETVTYTYGDNGRLGSVTDNRGTTAIAYETDCDRVASVTDPETGTVSYTYTRRGALESKTLPSGRSWTYHYNYSGVLAGDHVGALKDGDPNTFRDVLDDIKDADGRTAYCYDSCNAMEFFNYAYDQYDDPVSYC
ncbi:unnamed protein product, partial [marine sediment metagenome]